jgi:hypothetical protein
MDDSTTPAAALDRPWPGFWGGVGLGFGAALLVAVPLGHLFGVRLPF